MKKLLARLPVLIIGIPLAFWLLVKAPNYARLIFLAIFALIGQDELSSMLDKRDRKPIFEWVATLIIMSLTYFFGEKAMIASFLGCGIAAMLMTVFRGLKGDGISLFCRVLFSLFYLPLCLSCHYLVSVKYGGMALFIILASVWCLDIGAYLTGMTFKGPKMAPKISPNKTISGAVGGFICSVGFLHWAAHAGWLTTQGYDIIPTMRIIYAAIAIGVVGQVADLFESVIKRESDTKDSGTLLGAHGGVLDRIDSVLFLGPLCYYIFTL